MGILCVCFRTIATYLCPAGNLFHFVVSTSLFLSFSPILSLSFPFLLSLFCPLTYTLAAAVVSTGILRVFFLPIQPLVCICLWLAGQSGVPRSFVLVSFIVIFSHKVAFLFFCSHGHSMCFFFHYSHVTVTSSGVWSSLSFYDFPFLSLSSISFCLFIII